MQQVVYISKRAIVSVVSGVMLSNDNLFPCISMTLTYVIFGTIAKHE